MSVKIVEKKDGKEWGRLEVTSEMEHINYEEYLGRMRALIRILQVRDVDFEDQGENYHILEILNDMVPTYDQAKKMFNSQH